MASVTAPVGLRNMTTPVASLNGDQDTVINLLGQIAVTDGGKRGVPAFARVTAGLDGNCPRDLAQAIFDFQQRWVRGGEFRSADGVVDPNGNTIGKMDALVSNIPIGPVTNPDEFEIDGITLRQVNDGTKALPHAVTNPVIRETSILLPRLQQIDLQTVISELRFQVVKPEGTFWVGVVIPEGTVDFSRTHIFFHPTPIQNGQVRAADGDYPAFAGGWRKKIELYMPRHGGQFAGALSYPLIIPYMTMASAQMSPATNVFATDTMETIRAILVASKRVMTNDPDAWTDLWKISSSSYSSGITYLSDLLGLIGASPIFWEAMDFDSTFIISQHKSVTGVPGGGNFLQFTQTDSPQRVAGRIDLPPRVWTDTHFFWPDAGGELPVHGKIGWMMFYAAMTMSNLGT